MAKGDFVIGVSFFGQILVLKKRILPFFSE
jgi:hypothetical protein